MNILDLINEYWHVIAAIGALLMNYAVIRYKLEQFDPSAMKGLAATVYDHGRRILKNEERLGGLEKSGSEILAQLSQIQADIRWLIKIEEEKHRK